MGGPTGVPVDTEPYAPFTFPLDFPAVGIRDVEWAVEMARGHTESPFTFHRQVFRQTGERWRVKILFPPMKRETAAKLRSFLLKLDGNYGTFYFGDPFSTAPRGIAFGSPVIDGANQTGKVIQVKGFNANVTGILKESDRIQIGSRLHEVTRDTNTDGAGVAILDIWPRLRESPADLTPIVTNDPKGRFELATPSHPLYSVGIDGPWRFEALDIVEVI